MFDFSVIKETVYKYYLQPFNQKTFAFWKERYDKPRQRITKQRCYFVEKGPCSQPSIFIGRTDAEAEASIFWSPGRTDAEAEASIFWSPDEKSQLNGQEPDAGKD